MSSEKNPPTAEELARELEQVRAAQPQVDAPPAASVAEVLKKRVKRAVILWAILVVAFLVIWTFLDSGK